jgi:hypothetical protein
MTSMTESVTELLVCAISKSLADLSPLDRQVGLAAYALVVDCDMTTVMGAAASRRFFDDQGDGLLFQPVDWPLEYHSDEFEAAGEGLVHLSGTYEAVLQVSCADGGGEWDKAEGDAVRQLNGAGVYEQWVRQRAQQ